MKKYLFYTYLLFVLLVTGAFASMAQNDYGKSLLGGVAAFFALLFIFQLGDTLRYTQRSNWMIAELICLIILSCTTALRIFNWSSRLVEWITVLTGTALISIYLFRIVYFSRQKLTGSLKVLILLFYSSLILFLISILFIQVTPAISGPFWFAAVVFLLFFAAGSWYTGPVHSEGEKLSVFQFVFHLKDRSLLLISLFVIFSLYIGFTRMGWLPRMYSNELPQSYYKLVRDAESGKEVPVNGRYQHEEFKKQYDHFVKKHADRRE